MDRYVTGAMIKRLREERKMTQQQLADKMTVSCKTISKWETGRGYPDISLVEPLAESLGVSIIELFAGEDVTNTNRAFNMTRMRLYVCPVCGNIVAAVGEAVVSCCGIVLPPLEAEPADEAHLLRIVRSEDELHVSVEHEMSKTHYISFIAAVRGDGYEVKKLYAEGAAEARFKAAGVRSILCCCNRHGLFEAAAVMKKRQA